MRPVPRKLPAVAALIGLAAPQLALADTHKLLVLQAEGRADSAVRAKVDAALFRLALAAEPQTTAGELNFSDAATAVGCKPETATCKDEVLGMLAVDEMVITAVNPKPGGLEIAVRRVGKGGATREATMLVATGTPLDKLDGIAPLFGAASGAVAPVVAPPPIVTPPPVGPSPTPGPAITAPDRSRDAPVAVPPPAEVAAAQPLPPPADPAPGLTADDSANQRRHRLEIAGMAGGGGMVVLGVVLWAAAKGVQNDIDHAPVNTKADLAHLKDLESKGDGMAGLGNLLVVGGVLIGGVGTFFFLKDRRDGSAVARLSPTLLDHGAGVVLTLGGAP